MDSRKLWTPYRAVRGVVDGCPPLYVAIASITRRGNVCTRRTEFVCDGYPRSGSGFAHMAFRLSQDRYVRISHHLHSASNIIRACTLGIPTAVLIRNPWDAIPSLYLRSKRVTLAQCIREYYLFYRRLRRHRNSVVWGNFHDVTNNFGNVVHRVNMKFNTRFNCFKHTPENVTRVMAAIDSSSRARAGGELDPLRVSRPTGAKDRAKAEVQDAIEEGALSRCMQEAVELYEELYPLSVAAEVNDRGDAALGAR